jgi:DNA-binding NtrC family response regulator
MANILVVDDELGIRDLLSEILNDEGHNVELAENAAQAREARLKGAPDLVLLDIWMPDTDGVSLLKEWSAAGLLTMPVIMMSGHATIDTAVEATRIGALAFLEKPITLQKLLKSVEQGLSRKPKVLSGVGTGASATRPAQLGSSTYPPSAVHTHVVHGSLASASSSGGLGAHSSGDNVPWSNLQSFDLNQPLRDARDSFEKAYFEYHLVQEGGSMTRVAEKTGLERTHLYRKLKQLGVDLSKGKRTGG